MATKTITIKEDAYNRLKRIKGDRSFSELIMDITENQTDLRDSIGLWNEETADKAEKRIKEFRESFEERFDDDI